MSIPMPTRPPARGVPRLVAALGHSLRGLRATWRSEAAFRLETRLAHVDSDIAVTFETRLDDAAHRLDPDLALVGQPLLMHETDKTAGAVAALFNLATIGIEDAITEIDTGLGRFFNEQDLVTADTEIPVSEITQLFRREVNLLAHAIENDEIVAQAMHLGKLELHERLRI